MIELYELRQFTAFADAKTLSAAAEILHLSQPALSRNMKKLEDELGIPLFERRKNKLTLNKNGEYVLELAKKLLDDADTFAAKARDFDRRNRTISLGVCAPAPVWRLAPLIANVFPSYDAADRNGCRQKASHRFGKQCLSADRHTYGT